MTKIYNVVASEYELPQLTPEPRYLRCEALTGEWWYKDMQTSEDLPLFTQPINWVHNDTLTFNQEKVFNEFVDNVIDPIEQCQKLQERIDKAIEYMNNYNELVIPTANIKSLVLKEEYKKIIHILQGDNNE